MADKVYEMTYDGVKKLQDELDQRKTVTAAEISERLKEARALGDLSENSEYDDAKTAQAENEMRKLEDDEQDASKAEGKEDDVVLDEALNILSDLVPLTGGSDIPMETEGDLRTRMMRIFGQDMP